jgi:hypothetical protein
MSSGLIGFVPDGTQSSLAAGTIPLLRVTNGSAAMFAMDAADQQLLPNSQVVDTGYRCFSKAGTGLVPLERFKKTSGEGIAYTYGAAARAKLLKGDGWSPDGILGYVALSPFDGGISLPVTDALNEHGQVRHSMLGVGSVSLSLSLGKIVTIAAMVLGVPPEAAIATGMVVDEVYTPEEDPDQPSQFYAVAKDPASTNATIWLGQFNTKTPDSSGNPAISGRLVYRDEAGTQNVAVGSAGWKSSINEQSAYRCFFQEIVLQKLIANTRQQVVFVSPSGKSLAACDVVTLPTALAPKVAQESVTVTGLSRFSSIEVLPAFAEVATTVFAASAAMLAVRDSKMSGAPAVHRISARAGATARLGLAAPVVIDGGIAGTAQPRDLGSRFPFANLPQLLTRLHDTKAPLTIFLGSCYSYLHDNGAVATAYGKLYWTHGIHPQINFWVGDQVYLDAPWHEYESRYSTDELRSKFTNRYHMTWTLMQSLHQSASNVFVADDHDFHNDYPRASFNVPLRNDDYRHTWQSIARKLFVDIQNPRATTIFSVGNDLSFFVLDARVNRTEKQFMKPEDLKLFQTWVTGLTCPGVIVCGQIIFDIGGKNELNLQDFDQFKDLCSAVSAAKHDIMFLSGDVHFGRVASVKLASGKTLYEVISSPLSLVEDEDGDLSKQLAKSRWILGYNKEPLDFPSVPVPNIAAQRIKYLDAVSEKVGDITRTAENFMTLKFEKDTASGGVAATITAWLPRRDPADPRVHQDFVRSVVLT